MATDTVLGLGSREGAAQARSVLDNGMREGARRLLQAALEAEVAEQLARFGNVVDTAGRRAVVRNGHLPVKQPRVRDRSGQMRFTSKILPPSAAKCALTRWQLLTQRNKKMSLAPAAAYPAKLRDEFLQALKLHPRWHTQTQQKRRFSKTGMMINASRTECLELTR